MSDDYILKQLDNDSNVIGYKPDLEYKKERTATGEATTSEEIITYDPDKDTTLYTKTLNGFSSNTPSSVLNDINYVLNNIKRLKNNLAKRFKEEQAMLDNPFYSKQNNNNDPNSLINDIIIDNPNQGEIHNPYNNIDQLISAGDNGDKDFTNQFEEQYNTIDGSVIPSLINQLSDIEEILSKLKDNISDLYYRDPNISIPDAKNIDDSYLKDMKLRERNKTNSSINYLAISFDSLLNKTVSYSVFQNNKSAIKVAKVIDSHEIVQATSNDMDILKKLFDEIEKDLKIRSRGYMRNDNLELIQKSMYNYYEKRKNLNDVYTLYRKSPDSKFLGRKVTEYSNDLRNAIKNVARVLLYNQNYLNKITELEKQKYNIQKISRSTSSNS